MGNLTGALLFVAFLKFPLIRIQPGFRRVGLSGVLAFPFYWYLHNLATKLKVKRSTFIVMQSNSLTESNSSNTKVTKELPYDQFKQI